MLDLGAYTAPDSAADEAPEASPALPSREERREDNFSIRAIDEATYQTLLRWAEPINPPNIAEELSDERLSEIAMSCLDGYDIDLRTLDDWYKQADEAIEFAMLRTKEKTEPWPGASNVMWPLVAQAAMQFASRAYPAIVSGRNLVKSAVIGDDSGQMKTDPNGAPVVDPSTGEPVWAVAPGEKAARAVRISDHMNYQLLEEMPEWDEDTDNLITLVSVTGCQFRKTMRDHVNRRNISVRVSPRKLVVNYHAKSLRTAPRISEIVDLYPHEVQERVADGRFKAEGYFSTSITDDKHAPIEFIEQHTIIDLDGDGYPEPYIVTLHRETRKVARITARFETAGVKRHIITGIVQRIEPLHYYTKYDFLPNMEGGLYGMGWAQLLLNHNAAINTILNQLIDAGTLQNRGGGFIGKGFALNGGAVRFNKPGEYKVVNVPGQNIKDNIVPLRFDGPSAALITLLTMLIDSAKDIAAIKDILTGELKAQTMSPTVFQSIVEQGLKVFTSIYKRLYRSLKGEYELLYALNKRFVGDTEEYAPRNGGSKIVLADDYQLAAGIEPYADPSMVVEAQRLARSEVLAQLKDDPMMNGMEIRKNMLESAQIPAPEKFLAGAPAPDPKLELEKQREAREAEESRARQFLIYAQALKAMADADKATVEPFILWAQEQMRTLSDVTNGNSAGGAGAQPSANAGAQASPRDAGDPALSAGLG